LASVTSSGWPSACWSATVPAISAATSAGSAIGASDTNHTPSR
jgi:hypothetical protein